MATGPTSPHASGLFPIALGCEGGLAVFAVGLGWALNSQPLAQVELDASGFAVGGLAALPLVFGLVLMTRYPVGPLGELSRWMERSVVPLFADWAIWQLLAVSMAAGIGEEFLFRGVIQGAMAKWGPPWLAVGLASALFGLAHLLTPTYAVVATVVGVYFGWLWLATDNLLAPVVAHGLYDFVALVYLTRRGEV